MYDINIFMKTYNCLAVPSNSIFLLFLLRYFTLKKNKVIFFIFSVSKLRYFFLLILIIYSNYMHILCIINIYTHNTTIIFAHYCDM